MLDQKYITRRVFLRSLTALGLSSATLSIGGVMQLLAQESSPFNFASDTSNPLAAEHAIDIRLPLIAEDGSNVPIVITMEAHPMEADHYIKTLRMVNFKDPVVGKGLYSFSPANGQAFLSSQLRLDGGDAEIFVIAECSQHGKWVASAPLKVSLGGC